MDSYSLSIPHLEPSCLIFRSLLLGHAKIVTRLDALRRHMLDGMGAAQVEPILEDLCYVAEYTGLEEEIAWREEETELAS